jgi:hypothetical protein
VTFCLPVHPLEDPDLSLPQPRAPGGYWVQGCLFIMWNSQESIWCRTHWFWKNNGCGWSVCDFGFVGNDAPYCL